VIVTGSVSIWVETTVVAVTVVNLPLDDPDVGHLAGNRTGPT
jgi:hypothetical protein